MATSESGGKNTGGDEDFRGSVMSAGRELREEVDRRFGASTYASWGWKKKIIYAVHDGDFDKNLKSFKCKLCSHRDRGRKYGVNLKHRSNVNRHLGPALR
jgi:hypothetical protein